MNNEEVVLAQSQPEYKDGLEKYSAGRESELVGALTAYLSNESKKAEKDKIEAVANFREDLNKEKDPKARKAIEKSIESVEKYYDRVQSELAQKTSLITELEAVFREVKQEDPKFITAETKTKDAAALFSPDPTADKLEYDEDGKRVVSAYSTEANAVKNEYDKKVEEIIEALRASFSSSDMHIMIDDSIHLDNPQTIGAILSELNTVSAGLTRLGGYAERQHREPHAYSTTEEKLKTIEEYEQRVASGKMEEITKAKPGFHIKRGFKPTVGIVIGKEALLKMADLERKMNALRDASFACQSAGLKSCVKVIDKLRERLDKEHTKASQEFEKSDFELIVESTKKQVEAEEKEDKKKKAMEEYAKVYAEFVDLASWAPNYHELETRLNEIAARGGLDDRDIEMAQSMGRTVKHEQDMEEHGKEMDKLDAKMKEEKKAIAEKELKQKLRAEISRKMANEGWAPTKTGPDPTWNGVDVDLNESDRLWNEELERRFEEEWKFYKASFDSQPTPTEPELDDEPRFPTEAKFALDEAITDRINDENKHNDMYKSQEVQDSLRKHYYKTIGMTREERALATLKRDGLITRPDATVDNITLKEIGDFEAQIKYEAKISEILEAIAFELAKAEYEKEAQERQAAKVAEHNLDNSFGGVHR